jgi:site-specific DNA recombinase
MKALYVRVSSDEQARTGHSTENQKTRLAAYATAQGWQQTTVYADEGHSGKGMDRPAMRQLVTDIRAKKIDAVITLSLDRLSRRLFHILEFVKLCDEYSVSYISVSESFDTSTPTGRLMLHLLGSVAEFERSLITERVKSNLRGIVERQKRFVSGKPVYGYVYMDKRLAIDPGQSSRVLDIFERFISGWSFRKIAKYLNDNGIVTSLGNPWQAQTVKQILQNEALTGVLVYDRNGTPIRVPNAHEAIVPPDMWEKAQARFARLKKGNGGSGGKYRTSGLVYCGYCGGKMYANTNRPGGYVYHTYTCSTYQKGGDCKHHYVMADKVEQAAFEFLEMMAEGIPIPQEQVRLAKERQVEDKAKRLARLDQKFQKQIEAYENDLISAHDLKLARERVERERQAIDAEPIQEPTPPQGAKTLVDIWNMDTPAVREGLKQLISRIVVVDQEVAQIVLADFWVL